MHQTELFPEIPKAEKIVNVASVPFRSPFRYAGGKTWLVPRIRKWMSQRSGTDKIFVEPFAGGGIVSLTVAFENLAGHVVMVEKDEDVAAVWRVILGGEGEWLANRIMSFDLTPESAREAINNGGASLRDRAFATIVKNRVNRGGILAEGASFIKAGENGKGIKSRWYAKTLKKRILEIHLIRHKISFIEGDAFDVMQEYADNENAVFFIDPPYTVAGRRLYRYSEIDHDALFDMASQLSGDFLMTYDSAEEVVTMAGIQGLDMRLVPMKNTHHAKKLELLIGRDLSWVEPSVE